MKDPCEAAKLASSVVGLLLSPATKVVAAKVPWLAELDTCTRQTAVVRPVLSSQTAGNSDGKSHLQTQVVCTCWNWPKADLNALMQRIASRVQLKVEHIAGRTDLSQAVSYVMANFTPP